MRGALPRSLLAELIGTFALVFTGAGAIVVDAMIYAVGHVSGAHLNPAGALAYPALRDERAGLTELHVPETRQEVA